MLRQRQLGFAFIRLLPKETGVRPIVNLRRRANHKVRFSQWNWLNSCTLLGRVSLQGHRYQSTRLWRRHLRFWHMKRWLISCYVEMTLADVMASNNNQTSLERPFSAPTRYTKSWRGLRRSYRRTHPQGNCVIYQFNWIRITDPCIS